MGERFNIKYLLVKMPFSFSNISSTVLIFMVVYLSINEMIKYIKYKTQCQKDY